MKSNNTGKLEKRKNSNLRKRRAVTEIISTMMLMGVTVSGASTLAYFMNDAFVTGNLGTGSTLDSSSLNILLLAYDTRDSLSLLTLSNVDNQYNSLLCALSCNGNSNDIPLNGGTEFIVFQIQNNNLDSIFLTDITLNDKNYLWDSSTSGIQLDVTSPLTGGKYPSDGTFSLLPVGNTPIIQDGDIEIESGEIRNVLVKLSSTDSDIELNKGIRVLLDVSTIQPIEFLLISGDAR